VPTWIFTKFIKFETFINFLKIADHALLDGLCNLYGVRDSAGRPSHDLLINTLYWVKKCRNCCAHSERFYNLVNSKGRLRQERYLLLLPPAYQRDRDQRFIDLLFYNLNLSCYVVVEVKIGKFEFADAGQLGGYVVSCNHILRKEGRDNPTIGLLICKERDRIQAQYALESSSQPIGISEYELERFYPEKVEGTIPTIEELEKQLERRLSKEDS
jgi:hypothetical protein